MHHFPFCKSAFPLILQAVIHTIKQLQVFVNAISIFAKQACQNNSQGALFNKLTLTKWYVRTVLLKILNKN